MLAGGFAGLEAQLWLWLFAMIRPGAMLLAAPITGARAVPVQLRLVVALALGMAGTSGAVMITPELVSVQGLVLITGEIIIGLAIGFAVQMGFAAAQLAGEVISNAMGLGFASMADPQTGQSTPVIGQVLGIVATLLFLAMDGHLMLAAIVVHSYAVFPTGGALPLEQMSGTLVQFAGMMLASGLIIAMPVGSALILTQIVMGVLARSAPSMNLFAVGLPATLSLGLVLLALAMPVMAEAIARSLEDSLRLAAIWGGG